MDPKKIFNYVKRDGPDGCWNWVRASNLEGYGRAWHNGKLHLTHRLAWEQARGPIPDGFQVLHRCDNPACINPDHLFLGTHVDNMRDRELKGRGVFEQKLNIEQVKQIRILLRKGIKQKKLAAMFGVSQAEISHIKLQRRWKNWRMEK